MLYSGIDLHKDMCWIATIDENGVVVKQVKLPNDPALILEYFRSLGADHKAVVESTSNWYWLSDLLRENGIELVLAHAKYVKAISYAKVKTDKVDSLTLAQLLRMNLIPVAHQISPELRASRDLMRARLNLVHKRISCINSIHRLFEKFNIVLTEHNLQTLQGFKELKEIPLPPEYQFHLHCLIDQILLLRDQITNLEKSLHPHLVPNPDIQRLLMVPGIGKISAFTIYLEIDDISRFPDDKHFFSYARLVPGASNSNQKFKHKSGNKDGNKYLKLAFTEIAVQAIQNYAEIKRFYQAKARKSPKAIARTIVAKEMARIVYHMLKEHSEFRTFKGLTLSKTKKRGWPRLSKPLRITGTLI